MIRGAVGGAVAAATLAAPVLAPTIGDGARGMTTETPACSLVSMPESWNADIVALTTARNRTRS
jgi:hypothetical protein